MWVKTPLVHAGSKYFGWSGTVLLHAVAKLQHAHSILVQRGTAQDVPQVITRGHAPT